MKLEALNCPNCGAPLHIQANQDLALCVYCDTTIRINHSGSGEASLTQQTTLQAEDAKLIKSLLLDGKREQAIACYDKSLALSPQDPEILTNRGNSLAGMGRYEEAIASYEKALVIDPTDRIARAALKQCLADRKKAGR